MAAGRSPRKSTGLLHMIRRRQRFNVAAGRSPRKCTGDVRVAAESYGFNVAAGRSPRKLALLRTVLNQYKEASMWPRAEAHGNPPGYCI